MNRSEGHLIDQYIKFKREVKTVIWEDKRQSETKVARETRITYRFFQAYRNKIKG